MMKQIEQQSQHPSQKLNLLPTSFEMQHKCLMLPSKLCTSDCFKSWSVDPEWIDCQVTSLNMIVEKWSASPSPMTQAWRVVHTRNAKKIHQMKQRQHLLPQQFVWGLSSPTRHRIPLHRFNRQMTWRHNNHGSHLPPIIPCIDQHNKLTGIDLVALFAVLVLWWLAPARAHHSPGRWK